jgi:hypothetical protein
MALSAAPLWSRPVSMVLHFIAVSFLISIFRFALRSEALDAQADCMMGLPAAPSEIVELAGSNPAR